MIGRVQAFTTLLTGVFGVVIFLIPAVFPHTAEASLYLACGLIITIAAAGLRLFDRSARS